MNRIHSLALAGALALVAVFAAPEAASAQQAAAAPAAQEGAERVREPRRRPDRITRQELAASGTTNLLHAVERLRPQWLRSSNFTNLRGAGTAIVVYQGSTQLGGLDALRQIAPEFAEELRFLDGSQASNTLPGLGSRAVGGAIVIIRPGHSAP